MPTPPNFKPNPLLPQFRWNERAAQYADQKTGRFVSRKLIRDQLDKVVDASSQVMRALSQQLRDGDISLADWQIGMMQQIKTGHLAAAAMQKGGWQQLSQSDFGRVGQIVRREYGFLRSFAEDIASGKQKLDGSLTRRSALYGQQARPTYLTFWESTANQKNFDEQRSILQPAEHCSECISEAAKGFRKIGDMIPIGQRICRSNDRCIVEFRNSQTGETLRV